MNDDNDNTITITGIDLNDMDGIYYDTSNSYITTIDYGNTFTSYPVDTGMQVDGDLIVKGRNVTEELDILKTLLEGAVIQRDPAMEEEFQKFKELAEQYQEQLEKYKTFKRLKESK